MNNILILGTIATVMVIILSIIKVDISNISSTLLEIKDLLDKIENKIK